MNLLPYFSALLITSSVAFTHSCNANTVEIGDQTVSKQIKLMHISPDRVDKIKMQAFSRASEKDYRNGITRFVNGANSSDLGMSGVPVLDQGAYGTCVTFASTAALDARLSKSGDVISQECSLALNSALGNNFWNGAWWPSQIIDPIRSYGLVSKAACPAQYPDDSYTISAENYSIVTDKALSAEVAQVKYVYSSKSDLLKLKGGLRAGHRVLIAFLINPVSQEAVQGFNIKVDGRRFVGGLWACKQGASAKYCGQSQAGHEVLVTGYDDKQQLLKIRNSWSEQVGEYGDYYMTYTFFNSQAVDQTEVY